MGLWTHWPSVAIVCLAWVLLPSPVHPQHTTGNVLACVAFMWNPEVMGSLVAVLQNFQTYETRVRVVVVTNEASALREYLQRLDLHVRVHQAPPLADLSYLPRVHFDIVKQAARTGRYATYMYVESDVLVPWRSIQAWAVDVTELHSRGFQRGFVRVGVGRSGALFCPDNSPVPTDVSFNNEIWRWPPIDLSTYDKLTNVSAPDHSAHFVQLRHPYWAGYVLTHEQLQQYMKSNVWAVDVRWGHQEDAACGNQMVNVPPGFDSNTVVPYNADSKEILSHAFVFHLSNKYAIGRGEDQLPISDVLKGPVT